MEWDAAFANVWGDACQPYPFQLRVCQLLAAGQRVILQAPTGAGKTRAALTAFLYSRLVQTLPGMPRKCLYAVPMRVLATQFYAEHSTMLSNATIQTGEQPDDPKLAGDLVFLTIDQLLSSFLTMPYGLSGRLANLNAGAVAGSYVVLDEFHLFDPESTLQTALDMLRRLEGLGPVLVMTATFSGTMLDELARILKAQVVTTSPQEVHCIETRHGTTAAHERTWLVGEGGLTAEVVLAAHKKRTLVVCNRVERARKLFDELQKGHPNVVLLHSRFLPEDRKRWEERLRADLCKESQADVIAVATQVVEVGLDISAEVLHTELAPAASLIQRAGRCARYPGERGEVRVYPVESAMPYGKPGHPLAADMERSLAWLQGHNGQVLGFGEEQALVNAACTERDGKILRELRAGAALHERRVDDVLTGDAKRRQAIQLVRDADSRRLVIHDRPDGLLAAPYAAQGFAVHPTVLWGALKGWQEQQRALGLPWAVCRLADRADPDASDGADYAWTEVVDENGLRGATLLAVHPALAGYDPRRGLLLDEGSGFRSAIETQHVAAEEYITHYRLEPYLAHVRQLLSALEGGVMQELLFPAERLEQLAGWPAGSMVRAAWLVCALHDVGKLTQAWQGWARKYQRSIGQPISEPVAHTEYDAQNPSHVAAQRAAGPRPHHAPEGAAAVSLLLLKALNLDGRLASAAVSAIARHHGPLTADYGTYRLGPWAHEQVQASLEALPAEARGGADAHSVALEGEPGRLALHLARPSQCDEWLAYTLLVRALRLADQAATAAGNR